VLLGAGPTPINWRESLFESCVIIVLAALLLNFTNRLFHRMEYLEGILPICAACKKVRDSDGHWHQVEEYISERTAADFSHGVCPDCARKLYPEFYKDGAPEGKK
jgi:hypothetical protein